MTRSLRDSMPGLFPASTPAQPKQISTIEAKLDHRPAPPDKTAWLSACCPHGEKEHCKGGETHHEYKPRMAGPPTDDIHVPDASLHVGSL
jgi:hypothetical protein